MKSRLLVLVALTSVALAVAGCSARAATTPTAPAHTDPFDSAPCPTAVSPNPGNVVATPGIGIDTSKSYSAIVTTGKGTFTIQLYPDAAPTTVNNFVHLARCDYYNGVTFHRVIPGFVAQTGDPTGTGAGGPGYVIKDEINQHKQDKPGVVAMANAGPGTDGSQFYITLAKFSQAQEALLDKSYTVFGQVTQGMNVVLSLTPRDPSKNANAPPGDVIKSIKIVEK